LLFEYDTGNVNYPYGGPVVGPSVSGVRQHIYFFRDDWTLVALTHVRPIPGDFDLDNHVDPDDFTFLMNCFGGPTVTPIVGTGCEAADLDGNGFVDQDDFGIFQRCFTGPDVFGDPNCSP
jgi:hypothetical protein